MYKLCSKQSVYFYGTEFCEWAFFFYKMEFSKRASLLILYDECPLPNFSYFITGNSDRIFGLIKFQKFCY